MDSETITSLSDEYLTNLIDRKSKHLNAMMALCTRDGFVAFSDLNDDLQHNYLWAIAEMVTDVRLKNDVLNDRRLVSRKQGT